MPKNDQCKWGEPKMVHYKSSTKHKIRQRGNEGQNWYTVKRKQKGKRQKSFNISKQIKCK